MGADPNPVSWDSDDKRLSSKDSSENISLISSQATQVRGRVSLTLQLFELSDTRGVISVSGGYHHITGGPRSTAAKTNEIQSELSCIAIKEQLDGKWNECRSEGQTLHISLDVSIRRARRGQFERDSRRPELPLHCSSAV